MKKFVTNKVVLIVSALLVLDVVLHLVSPAPPSNQIAGLAHQYLPQQTTSDSISGIIGGLMVLGVIYLFFAGMHATFRAHRSFHRRMKTDGIWKRSR